MKTHISYETAKRLKAFLGDNAPEMMKDNVGFGRWYVEADKENLFVFPDAGTKENYPAYQLHDILSRPFCEAFAKNLSKKEYPITRENPDQIAKELLRVYYPGGLPAVCEELDRMMGGK